MFTAVSRIHRAWWIVAITFLTLISAAAFRSTTGVMLVPLEEEFGWSRSVTSGAVALHLLMYGITAPFAATLIERFSMRRVVSLALLLVATGLLNNADDPKLALSCSLGAIRWFWNRMFSFGIRCSSC